MNARGCDAVRRTTPGSPGARPRTGVTSFLINENAYITCHQFFLIFSLSFPLAAGYKFTLKGHTSPIGYLAVSSDRKFLANYNTDTSIRIWGIPE